MSVLTVPYLVGALLLLMAGVAKLASPESTVDAARGAGLPARRGLVRVLAALEVGAGAAALVSDSWVAGATVGVFYVGFAGFLAQGLLRGGLATCGCFAGDRAQPSWLHVALDILLAGAAFGVATDAGAGSLRAAFAEGHDVTSAVLVVTGAALAYVVLSGLPEVDTVSTPMLLQDGAGPR